MKKKLLSLVLAGAMVASTSVSAFAATEQGYNILGKEEVKTPITVTGNVQDTAGQIVAGTISVSVPTAAAFTVTSTGDFTSAPIEITSDSAEQVQVTAYSFTDSSENKNITIVSEEDLKNETNSDTQRFMTLRLQGNDKTVYFKSAKTTSGIYKENYTTEYALDENPVLGIVTKDTPLELNLKGEVKKDSYSAPGSAIQDKFNLVLKIRRAR